MPFVRSTLGPPGLICLLSCAGPTPFHEPADFLAGDYVMTVARNSYLADSGPAEWRQLSDDLFQVQGYYRVASGDPNSGIHRLLLRRETRKDGSVRYEVVGDTLEE